MNTCMYCCSYFSEHLRNTPLNIDAISIHRRLQSCVGTRARLGYAAFDAQLRKEFFLSLHCTLYVRLSVGKHVYAYRCTSLRQVLVI